MNNMAINEAIIASLTDRELQVLMTLAYSKRALLGSRLSPQMRNRIGRRGRYLSAACAADIISNIRTKTSLTIKCKNGRYKLVVA
jgi:hypothetical protein